MLFCLRVKTREIETIKQSKRIIYELLNYFHFIGEKPVSIEKFKA